MGWLLSTWAQGLILAGVAAVSQPLALSPDKSQHPMARLGLLLGWAR